MQQVTKAVIPCAGFGTRFLPATKAVPKELFPIIDVPSLQLIVQECVDSGIKDILFIVSETKHAIKYHFSKNEQLETLLEKNNKTKILEALQNVDNLANFHYEIQHVANGTGNAILLAEKFVNNEPFAVLYGDDLIYTGKETPVIKQLIDAYEKTNKLIVGCQTVEKEEATKYGVVNPGKTTGNLTEIKGFVEKPSIDKLPSTLASLGRYVLTPDIFDYIRKSKVSECGEKYVTDAIETIAIEKGAFACDFIGRRYDIGDKNGYIEAIIEYGLRSPETKDRLEKYLINLLTETLYRVKTKKK